MERPPSNPAVNSSGFLVLKLESQCGDPERIIRKVRPPDALDEFTIHRVGSFLFAVTCLPHPPLSVPEEWKSIKEIKQAWIQKEPFVLASRQWQMENTEIVVQDLTIGGNKITIIAGPCSVESREQILEVAQGVKEAGATFLRGGAFKPRTSPYSFRGLGKAGLEYLAEAGEATGLPVVTEVMSVPDVDLVGQYTDIFQVGSRNAQNFSLLERLGEEDKPILLKRGFGCTVEELLLSAEYIMSSGNFQIILCERGIRTFEPTTRFTFDVASIPMVKQQSHLPIIADPSHGTGNVDLVAAVARSAVAAGADGLILEVHPEPEKAKSDGKQSLTLPAFTEIINNLKPLAEALGRSI